MPMSAPRLPVALVGLRAAGVGVARDPAADTLGPLHHAVRTAQRERVLPGGDVGNFRARVLILLRDVADLRGHSVPGPRLRGERASRRGDQARAHARYLRLSRRPDGAAAPLVHARRRRGVVNKHR